MRTEIRAPELDPSLSRLSSSAKREIGLTVNSKLKVSDSIGNQYLMVLIPFGSIKTGGAKHILTNSALEKLSLLGFKPKLSDNMSQNSLTLYINDIKLTAYDYFVVRKILCEIDVTGELRDSSGQVIRLSSQKVTESSYKKFAFRPELEYSFRKAADKAVSLILNELLGIS